MEYAGLPDKTGACRQMHEGLYSAVPRGRNGCCLEMWGAHYTIRARDQLPVCGDAGWRDRSTGGDALSDNLEEQNDHFVFKVRLDLGCTALAEGVITRRRQILI